MKRLTTALMAVLVVVAVGCTGESGQPAASPEAHACSAYLRKIKSARTIHDLKAWNLSVIVDTKEKNRIVDDAIDLYVEMVDSLRGDFDSAPANASYRRLRDTCQRFDVVLPAFDVPGTPSSPCLFAAQEVRRRYADDQAARDAGGGFAEPSSEDFDVIHMCDTVKEWQDAAERADVPLGWDDRVEYVESACANRSPVGLAICSEVGA